MLNETEHLKSREFDENENGLSFRNLNANIFAIFHIWTTISLSFTLKCTAIKDNSHALRDGCIHFNQVHLLSLD